MFESVHELQHGADPPDVGVDGRLTHKLIGQECVERNLDLDEGIRWMEELYSFRYLSDHCSNEY